jgi:hypothetical protein
MKNFKHFFNEKTEKRRLDPKCWKGYRKAGTKLKGDVRVNKCVKVKEEKKQPVLDVTENIEIEGVGLIAAKIDSGNEAYNVLHGVDIKIESGNVTFTTVENKTITLPLRDTIKIHIGSGVKEERPVVVFNIKLHGESYKDVPFSIADRSENSEPILIGELFLKQINALIDMSSGS